jgi:hypothetical protein
MKTRAFRAYQAPCLPESAAAVAAGLGWQNTLVYQPTFCFAGIRRRHFLMVLAQVAFNAGQPNQAAHSEHEDHQHGPQNLRSLWWLALPVAIGFLLPAKPLGTTALNRVE